MYPMTRAGIYVRISQDRTGAGLGVARQEQDCRALCGRLGWSVAQVYPDNDVSAYSGKPRPQWQRLVEDVKSGTVDAIAVWHVDRLTRSPRELEDVVDLADRHGLALATVTGEVDLATSTGRMVARIMGAASRHESEHKSERQIRQRRQAAEQGRDNGGPRPYGFEGDRQTIREGEAVVIREVAARLLARESLTSVCRDLNDRGLVTSRGNPWQKKPLRNLMLSARISGRREHNPWNGGKTPRPLTGEVVAAAAWPPIITPDDSDRLRALLTAKANGGTTRARSYLLSGILRCQCEAGLVGRPVGGKRRYICHKRPGVDNCGTISVTTGFADDVVRDLVLVALESDDFRARLYARAEVDPVVRKAVVDDERRLVELAEEWADPGSRMSRGEWRAAREKIEARLDGNRRTMARATDTAPLDGMTGTYDDLLVEWERRNTSQRRAVVAAVLVKVIVGPARRKLDVDRFDPRWRA